MKLLRILGVLMILSSAFFFWRFQSQMQLVKEAKEEASRISLRSSGPGDRSHDEALAREDAYRAVARNWFLGGAGMIVFGAGLIVAPWVLAKRRPTTS